MAVVVSSIWSFQHSHSYTSYQGHVWYVHKIKCGHSAVRFVMALRVCDGCEVCDGSEGL